MLTTGVELPPLLFIQEALPCSPNVPTGSRQNLRAPESPLLLCPSNVGTTQPRVLSLSASFWGICCLFLPLGLCQHPQGFAYSWNWGKRVEIWVPPLTEYPWMPQAVLIIKVSERSGEGKAQQKTPHPPSQETACCWWTSAQQRKPTCQPTNLLGSGPFWSNLQTTTGIHWC